MEYLLLADRQLFLTINHLPHTVVLDGVALILSGVGTFGLVWLFVSVWLFWKVERKDDQWFFLPVVIATTLSWLVTDLLIKSAVGRMRPAFDIGAIIVDDTAPGYSFPSTHATFSFALAFVLAKTEPRFRTLFYVVAALISLSRVYLGVHFPSDIAIGALVGLGIGYGTMGLTRWIEAKRIQHNRKKKM